MRILIYKRTHIGDPDASGHFGVNSCMGRVRDYEFDAVIGVGGIGAEPRTYGIDRKINWVGINPAKHNAPGKRACEVTFAHFVYFEEEGPQLDRLAPNLAKRLFEGGARLLVEGYSDLELNEAKSIIEWSRRQNSSKTSGVLSRERIRSNGCKPPRMPKGCGC